MDHRESPAQGSSLHLPDTTTAGNAAPGSKQVRVQLEAPVDTLLILSGLTPQLQAWLSKILELAQRLGHLASCTMYRWPKGLSLHAGRWG